MAALGDSSDTLIPAPEPAHTLPPRPAMDSELELSVIESTPPIVPKLLREASDITWQDGLESKEQVTLVRRRGLFSPRFRLLHQRQFRNSLLASVGYLELANAGDFAANVWNQIPVPTFAAVLMGIGGTLALGMVLVAVQDFRLSWRNVLLLREERTRLQRLREYHEKNPELRSLLDSRLAVGIREIGTEVVDRLVMDVLLGSGSVLVGVGTLMAIGGANHRVFEASNLLSGYIGNALAALFGLVNAIWSGYLIYRFYQHDKAVLGREPSDDIQRRLRTRFRRFQWHAFVNGLNGLVAGAASMVTAERWWGYVVLIPCIISLILCNYFWRQKLGYDRPVLDHGSLSRIQLTHLVEDLKYVTAMQRLLAELDENSLRAVAHAHSFDSMLQFITRNRMFEIYCDSLARDRTTRPLLQLIPLTEGSSDKIIITHDVLLRLLTSQPEHNEILSSHARRFLRTEGVRVFNHRERHLLELFGYAVWNSQMTISRAPTPPLMR